MKAMKQILWDIKNDLILLTDKYNTAGPDDEYITGEAHQVGDGWKVVLHQDDLTAPANIDYFVRLWNASYPEKTITNKDVLVSNKVVTAASRLVVPEKHIERLDFDQYPIFGQYMNSPGHIHPEADPEMMKKRKDLVGDLGELIVKNAKIPGLTRIHDDDHDVDHPNHPIDILFSYDVGNGPQPFGAEIKAASSHNARPFRYSLTGYGAKSSKQSAIDKLSDQKLWSKYSPSMIGITLRYDDNKADVYMLPHQIGSFSRSTEGAIPLVEDLPFDFNGFHPDPYHQSRAPERRVHGVDWQQKWKESPNPEDIF